MPEPHRLEGFTGRVIHTYDLYNNRFAPKSNHVEQQMKGNVASDPSKGLVYAVLGNGAAATCVWEENAAEAPEDGKGRSRYERIETVCMQRASCHWPPREIYDRTT